MASTCTSLLLHRKPVQRKYRRFLLKFQTKEQVLNANKSKITSESTFNEDHSRIEGTHGLIKDKKLCFGYFCRFVINGLTLRPRNTYTYVFRALFGFCNFFSHFLRVLEARTILVLFYNTF